MNESLLVRREIQIEAPPATVFAFLTDPEKILRWMGAEATTEAQPGGLYLVKGIGTSARVARGAFREVVPVHRLAYSFGWEGHDEVPPGSSLIEIDLIDRNGGTLLRMTHSGLPNALQCLSRQGLDALSGPAVLGSRRSRSRYRSRSGAARCLADPAYSCSLGSPLPVVIRLRRLSLM
jgi:uncharacterized protein YndB with AHSA1/START domain